MTDMRQRPNSTQEFLLCIVGLGLLMLAVHYVLPAIVAGFLNH